MEKHPIERLMGTSMESIREMVDVNTVVGDPVQTQDGSTIIPISKVSFGFVAGGGEYDCKSVPLPLDESGQPLPFAGGTGAGVTVSPVAFLMVSGEQVRLLPAVNSTPIDRLVEMIPQIVKDVKDLLPGNRGVTEIHI